MKIPIHIQIYRSLKQEIEAGVFKPGSLLPSENQLCERFNTTRPTVRQALVALEVEGFIRRHQGKGSIVQEPRKGAGILSIEGTTYGFRNKNLTTEILAGPERLSWPQPFWFDLTEQTRAAGCIRMERLRKVDGIPMLYEETFITDIELSNFLDQPLENASLFETLYREYDIKITGGEQKIWATQASSELAKLLHLKSGDPVLHLKRKIESDKPDFHIFSSVYCNTQAYFLEGRF